jgi:hypothetical protein
MALGRAHPHLALVLELFAEDIAERAEKSRRRIQEYRLKT